MTLETFLHKRGLILLELSSFNYAIVENEIHVKGQLIVSPFFSSRDGALKWSAMIQKTFGKRKTKLT